MFRVVFIWYGSGSNPDPDPVFFDDQIFKKSYNWTKLFWDQKLQSTYPKASIKHVQAIEEAFSPQKRTSSTSKRKFLNFSIFVGNFCPPGSGSSFRIHRPNWVWIQSGSGSETLAQQNSRNLPVVPYSRCQHFFSPTKTTTVVPYRFSNNNLSGARTKQVLDVQRGIQSLENIGKSSDNKVYSRANFV